MSSDEVDFLRDQVERLNALLGKYQEQYSLPLQEDDVDTSHRPWLTEKELVSPLMQEYDATLQQLQTEADHYKNQVLDFRQQLGELLSENDRLRQDVKDIVNQTLDGGGGSIPSSSAGQLSSSASPSAANLQHQLRLAMQEKEVCQERWREATQELDRVEAEMQAMKDSHQWRSVEKQAVDIQDQYAQSVTVLNSELETLQSDLRQVRQELADSQRQILELKKTNYALQQQLAMRNDERAENIFKEGITDSKMGEVQRIMEDLRQRAVNANREAEDMKREKSMMEARVTELTRRLGETEQRENEAIQQVRDAITMAETSVLEKDQTEIQMHHKDQEVSQLQDSLAKIINEAGARTREEVDNVRKQSNDRVIKLTEELHALELENTERQAQAERLLREKRAVESELHKISREGKLEGTRTKDTVEELSRRLSEAERTRDDLTLRVETLTQNLDKERNENQQLKESCEMRLQTIQDRLIALQQEYDNSNDDRLRHVDNINTLTKKLQQAEQEKDGVHRKFLKELALIEQDQQTKTRGFEVQLQTTEDARRTNTAELRKLLTAQQRMSARWKEECQTITHKFEGKIEELRGEMTQLKRRNDQLTSLLKESQTKTVEAERVMSEYTRNIRRMETRMLKAESHSADISKRMSRHHMKERQLESERQSLMNELSRSQRDRSQNGIPNDSLSKSALLIDDLHSSR
ncbi:sodium channel and clathrin linker 1-like isoform X2 [Littorina saxatilis]|uniref:Sodium channel and clathrin linker 1 n=1 Tax=Littorina saxatilis TaxID=31220 RepID=A0AAN9G806_9CAEN